VKGRPTVTRTAKVNRKTTETEIFIKVTLDGTGKEEISTTIPFFDHMLTLFTRHGLFDLNVMGQGDTEVDYHHLVEDMGLCLGEVIKKALGNKKGITRYGSASVPMDETLSQVSVDISGRPYLVFNADFENKNIKDFDPLLFKEFFKAFCDHSGITLHVNVIYGSNPHHITESIFKAFARALNKAVSFDPRISGVMSTKGSL
jgi:imidazoleglycerol-phosphate dehydratase